MTAFVISGRFLRKVAIVLSFAIVLVLQFHWILSFVPANPGFSLPSSFSNNNGTKGRIPFSSIGPIQKIIHQSWRDNNVPKLAEKATRSWPQMNPSHDYRFYTDEMMEEYVKRQFPQHLHLFRKFPQNVMRSDFFRYLVVLGNGGVWSDIDTVCLRPIDKWTGEYGNVSAIVGVELDASDVITDWFSLQLQFCQWTFAFSKGHPLLQHVVDTISLKYNDSSADQMVNRVHHVTGPTIWTNSILEYFRKRGYVNHHAFRFLNEPVLVGDVLIMPVTAFSPDNRGMKGQGPSSPKSLVRHLFLGSWH